ncbi:hypothetical protein [Halorubrum vacuolatum]|uniref:Gamma-glutamyl:cysteine ligase YbdK, ATP-grasp superfamily n=1 Tax=Halorubrum vacuolatum TaxID=63740 RepID=A0A238WAA2_HALVU|nr:hypothetical protein [Halorubrum vacuolatum]SNR43311.1 hypothetical protein SAMN06264855_10683 [Halorubrum vacuolatum]
MNGKIDRAIEFVHRSLDAETAAEFDARIRDQAEWLRSAIETGEMDNDGFATGLELEVYAVTDERWTDSDGPYLSPLPDAVFETQAANKELGHHNIEINTEPTLLTDDGLATQATAIRDRTAAARAAVREHDRELVLDSIWTLPPADGTIEYLSAIDERDGVVVAANMRPDSRYLAIDNHVLEYADGGPIPLSVPGVEQAFPSMLFESLATSMQPHYQVPSAADLPAAYNTAIRTMGPVLALSANSPFLPADLYTHVEDPATLCTETHAELRIAVFEQSANHTPNPKVGVPRDIRTATDVVDRVLEDDLCAPFLREWVADDPSRGTLSDRIWEFDHKRGTYWRWLRCVIGGDYIGPGNDERSLRIEYRPIPTQPTVTDVIGMQAIVVGLIHGLVDADHPIVDLPWRAAESNFYNAAEDGLDADLEWITADGERTTDRAVLFEELFTYARHGLETAGVPAGDIERYCSPIEARWESRTAPSDWKRRTVLEAVEQGTDLPGAIADMQRAYLQRSLETDSFAEWL